MWDPWGLRDLPKQGCKDGRAVALVRACQPLDKGCRRTVADDSLRSDQQLEHTRKQKMAYEVCRCVAYPPFKGYISSVSILDDCCKFVRCFVLSYATFQDVEAARSCLPSTSFCTSSRAILSFFIVTAQLVAFAAALWASLKEKWVTSWAAYSKHATVRSTVSSTSCNEGARTSHLYCGTLASTRDG